MSEPQQKREWRFYIDDMIGFGEKVLSYTGYSSFHVDLRLIGYFLSHS